MVDWACLRAPFVDRNAGEEGEGHDSERSMVVGTET